VFRLLQEASKYIVRKLSAAKQKVVEHSRRVDAMLKTESGGLMALIEMAERCEKWEEAGDIMRQLDQRSKFGYVMRVRDWFQVLLPGLVIEPSSSSSQASQSSKSKPEVGSQATVSSGQDGEEKEAKGDQEEEEEGGGQRRSETIEQVRRADTQGYLVPGNIREDLEDILNCSEEKIMAQCQWQGAEEERMGYGQGHGQGNGGRMEMMRLVKEMEVDWVKEKTTTTATSAELCWEGRVAAGEMGRERYECRAEGSGGSGWGWR